MLDTIVRYLHESLIPFRLSSYPSLEHLPKAAQPTPAHAIQVDTQLVMAGDKPTLLCFVATDHVDLNALSHDLGVPVVDATTDDLPAELQRYEGPPPPLGQLFGLPLVVDERVVEHGAIVFQPFGESDFIEIPYDDFARQEQPRVASFARAGELPAHERGEAASAAH